MARLTRWLIPAVLTAGVLAWASAEHLQTRAADRAWAAYQAHLRTHPEEVVARLEQIPVGQPYVWPDLQWALLGATGERVEVERSTQGFELRVVGREQPFVFRVSRARLDGVEIEAGTLWYRVL